MCGVHAAAGNPAATVVADLGTGTGFDSERFDCIICTQTLQFVYEVRNAISTLHRALAPGGVLLATIPGISQISRYDMDRWGEYWRFTSLSTRKLFCEMFDEEHVTVEVWGNVLAAVAFLHGLAGEELREKDLFHQDPDYEMIIAVRARKAVAGSGTA